MGTQWRLLTADQYFVESSRLFAIHLSVHLSRICRDSSTVASVISCSSVLEAWIWLRRAKTRGCVDNMLETDTNLSDA